MPIHPTAVVSEKATISLSAQIGPYCIIGPEVTLKDNVHLIGHVAIDGKTILQEDVVVFPFTSIGYAPQHTQHSGQSSCVTIGKRTVIREHVTIHKAIEGMKNITSIGDDCFIMASCHVAHDCQIADHVIMANGATLGGHVEIGSHANIGGMTAIQQFTRIGQYSMIGGASAIATDLIPYTIARGNPARLEGLNVRGLKRQNFSKEEISALRQMFNLVFLEGQDIPFAERILRIEEALLQYPSCQNVHKFLTSHQSGRSFCFPMDGDLSFRKGLEAVMDQAAASL